jgi:uncharacterized protein
VKLIQVERESVQLADEVGRWSSHLTSVIGDVEFRRAAVRWKVESVRLEHVLAHLVLIELDEPIRSLAGRVGSQALRSLDAIHLATALSLGDDLGAFCCYDLRLRSDARDAGLTVLSPGLD